MLRKITGILCTLSLSLLLSNCTTEQLNTVNKIVENLKEFKGATINISSVDSKDIDEVQVDGKKLSAKDYSSSNTQLNLPNLEPGKHVVKFNHKKYGSTDVPIDVRSDKENNYQFNPTITNDKINDWELGIDANKDGVIDNNSFVSRQIENYVVVREFSGTTNYLPKQDFPQEYKQPKKEYPKPENFNFPGFKGNQPGAVNQQQNVSGFSNEQKNAPGFNDPRREQKPVFLTKEPNFQGQTGNIIPKGSPGEKPGQTIINNPNTNPNMGQPKQDMSLSSKVNIPFPKKLITSKIIGVFIGEQLLPENAYIKEKDSLIFRGEALKGKNNIMKVYLIDETGQGVLLSINPKRPIFNNEQKNSQNQLNREIFVEAEDLDYSLQKNIKLDPQKIEQLKLNNQATNNMLPNEQPFQQGKMPPNQQPFQQGQQEIQPRQQENMGKNGKLIPIPFGKIQGNANVPVGDTNKYVKIDENGEITDYIDNVPPENEQDFSLRDNK